MSEEDLNKKANNLLRALQQHTIEQNELELRYDVGDPAVLKVSQKMWDNINEKFIELTWYMPEEELFGD